MIIAVTDEIRLYMQQHNTQTQRKKHRLLRSSFIVACMTMISRILGFVRDIILAQTFGAGAAFDAFVVAFKIPNFFRRLFGEGAFSQAFVPTLADFHQKNDPPVTEKFINQVFGTLSVGVCLVIAIAEVFAPGVVMLFAPGFMHDPQRYLLAKHMLHVTFPYLFFIAITAFLGATLNSYRHFAAPAITPVLLNIALIAAALLLAPLFATPIYALAWGVMIGGVLQLGLQYAFMRKLAFWPVPRWGLQSPAVKLLLKRMIPALFGVSVAQIGLLLDNFFASFLPAGSITWLYYSDRLTYLPLGVIGVALATVTLPTLSGHHASDNQGLYKKTLDWGLRMVLFTGIPAGLALYQLAGPLLTTLFHHGAFDNRDVWMTIKSLHAFAIGLPGFMLIKLLGSAFYARKDIKTPVYIAAICLLINIVLNLILIKPMAHAGLALGTAIAATCNAVMLLSILIKRKIYTWQPGWKKFMIQLITANSMMGAWLWYACPPTSWWLTWSVGHCMSQLAEAIIAGVAIYAATLWLLGMRHQDWRTPNKENK